MIAEEAVNKWALDDGDLLHDAAIEALKEFAQFHVREALIAASENAKMKTLNDWGGRGFYQELDKESILLAYPLNNIQ